MNILHIPTGGLLFDGVLSCIEAYLKAIDKSEIKVDVLATNTPNQAVVGRVSSIDCGLKIIPDRKKNIIKYWIKLYKLIKKEHYEIVHIHGSSALMSIELLAAFLAGCRVRIVHSHNTKCENPKIHKLLRPLFNELYTCALACGKEAGKWLFGERTFKVLPNGRDLKKYEFSQESRNFWRTNLSVKDELIVGHVGRFNKQKNQKYLIEIFNQLHVIEPSAKMVLIGNGELFDTIKQLIKEYDLSESVILLGEIDCVNEILSAMDIMVLPSLNEGLPLVVVEWQAAGLPCIISDNVTTECIIMDNVFRLSVDDAPSTWANTIMSIKLCDRTKSIDSVKSKMTDANYDIVVNAEKLLNIYKEQYMELKK
jgi:glycosyltransferase involved in cell wall biosynthesis